MTQISSVIDSTSSVQGREGVETYRKENSTSVGKPLQVEGSELPLHTTLKKLVEPEEMAQMRNQLNALPQVKNARLAFEMTDEDQNIVLKVVDSETGDVIRQIPEEQVLVLRKMLADGLDALGSKTGLLLQTDT